MPSYTISADGKSITCLKCQRTSHNPNDVRFRYCGWCHVFHEDPDAVQLVTREVIELGDHVECDFCSKDWTESDVHGGFLFESKAVCPDCAPKVLASVRQHNEMNFIREYCPRDLSFADWVRRLRYGNNQMTISTSE